MPINVRWADAEETIVVYEYVSSWTWEELYNATRTVETWTGGKKRIIPVIHDLTNSRMLPKDVFFHGQRLTVELPEGAFAVIVGAGAFARIVIDTLRRLNRSFDEQYKTAATLDEAVDLIKKEVKFSP